MREFQNWLMMRLVPSFKLKLRYLYKTAARLDVIFEYFLSRLWHPRHLPKKERKILERERKLSIVTLATFIRQSLTQSSTTKTTSFFKWGKILTYPFFLRLKGFDNLVIQSQIVIILLLYHHHLNVKFQL